MILNLLPKKMQQRQKTEGGRQRTFRPLVRIIVSDMIYVEKKDYPSVRCGRSNGWAHMQTRNFIRPQKMRLPTYDKPRYISVYEEDELCLAIPRGRLERLRSLLKEAGAQFSMEDRRNEGTELEVAFQGTLRDEQGKSICGALCKGYRRVIGNDGVRQDGRRGRG